MSETASSPAEVAFSDLQWLQGLARHMAGNPHDADDLVQDTLITAWTRPPAVRDDVRPWLGTVLRNRLRMRRRGDARRQRRERANAPGLDAAPSPDQELARISVLRHLTTELEQLPPDDQRLIVRRFFEGQSAADIGRALNIPAATIRSRISRSLQRLRVRLDERCDGRDAWCAAVLAAPIPGAAETSAKPTEGPGTMIKTSMVVLAVAGTAAGVAVTRGVDADGSEAPATDERAPDRDASVGAEQAKPLVADAAGVGASAGQRSDEAAEGGDELRGKWAARKTAIRSVLGESGAEPGVAPQQHKLGYAKLIRACVKDLQDVPATLSVKLTEIGAPDVGTIVAAAEVISTSVDNPAVTECAEQSMYAYVGDAPPTAYERSYRFTVVLPGKKFTPEILDMMFAQNMANRFRPVRRCESAGVKGHIELELEIGDDGKTKSVAVAESSVDASIGECITKDAVEWQFPPMLAGKERRYRYTLPVQAPKVRRK